jgi:hypothetical protein
MAAKTTTLALFSLLPLALTVVACGRDMTGLAVGDGGGGSGGASGSGGQGGATRGRPDASIDDRGGSGGGGTGGAGSGGSGGIGGGGTGGGGSGGAGGAIDAGTRDAAGPDASTGNRDTRAADTADACNACQGFFGDYAIALRQEQACNPDAPNQCLKMTPSSLVCGCPVWVTTTVATDAIRQRFLDAGCGRCPNFQACPAIACVNPGTGVCVRVSAAPEPDPARPIVAPPPGGQCMSQF